MAAAKDSEKEPTPKADPFAPAALQTLTVTLPGGKSVKVREPSGEDELAASRVGQGEQAALEVEWGQILRCTLEVDGEKLDASRFTAQTFRAIFTSKQWARLRGLFIEEFYVATEEEERVLQDSRKMGVH